MGGKTMRFIGALAVSFLLMHGGLNLAGHTPVAETVIPWGITVAVALIALGARAAFRKSGPARRGP